MLLNNFSSRYLVDSSIIDVCEVLEVVCCEPEVSVSSLGVVTREYLREQAFALGAFRYATHTVNVGQCSARQ